MIYFTKKSIKIKIKHSLKSLLTLWFILVIEQLRISVGNVHRVSAARVPYRSY